MKRADNIHDLIVEMLDRDLGDDEIRAGVALVMPQVRAIDAQIKRIRAKRAKNGGAPVNGRTVAENRSELRKETAQQWSIVNKAHPQVQWQDRIFSAASRR